jgi:hypothetical protein
MAEDHDAGEHVGDGDRRVVPDVLDADRRALGRQAVGIGGKLIRLRVPLPRLSCGRPGGAGRCVREPVAGRGGGNRPDGPRPGKVSRS